MDGEAGWEVKTECTPEVWQGCGAGKWKGGGGSGGGERRKIPDNNKGEEECAEKRQIYNQVLGPELSAPFPKTTG